MPKNEDGTFICTMTEENLPMLEEMMAPMFEGINQMCKEYIDQCETEVIQFSPGEHGSDNQG